MHAWSGRGKLKVDEENDVNVDGCDLSLSRNCALDKMIPSWQRLLVCAWMRILILFRRKVADLSEHSKKLEDDLEDTSYIVA